MLAWFYGKENAVLDNSKISETAITFQFGI